ncbi:MAG: DNA-3-methyladenine glycosylase I [Gammaproteobacteria bacterium]|nr:DNA-3-methyladenine glycosylase I [Gammaproteobacteria bacterium]
MSEQKRCWWCGDNELYMAYHDNEWGTPLHDERALFEFLCLEGAQAGLSWITILKKRQNYQLAFDHFDAQKIAGYQKQKIDELLQNSGIVRNKLKVNGFVKNAKAYLEMLDQGLTLDQYFWDFVDGEVIQNSWSNRDQVPANTPLSDAISKDLKKRGFTFVGSTICYAFMQATGMINDHLVDCFRYEALSKQ